MNKSTNRKKGLLRCKGLATVGFIKEPRGACSHLWGRPEIVVKPAQGMLFARQGPKPLSVNEFGGLQFALYLGYFATHGEQTVFDAVDQDAQAAQYGNGLRMRTFEQKV